MGKPIKADSFGVESLYDRRRCENLLGIEALGKTMSKASDKLRMLVRRTQFV